MKTKIFIPLALICVTLLCIIVWTGPFDTRWSNSIEALAVSIALFISGGALFYAKREYEHNKKSERTALLCQYLQRYSNDPCIKKMEEYIMETALLDENEVIIGFDKSKVPSIQPSLWEKEMFMHFFEEIQLLIDDNMINKDVVTEIKSETDYFANVIINLRISKLISFVFDMPLISSSTLAQPCSSSSMFMACGLCLKIRLINLLNSVYISLYKLISVIIGSIIGLRLVFFQRKSRRVSLITVLI